MNQQKDQAEIADNKISVVRCGECILCHSLCPMYKTWQSHQWVGEFCSWGLAKSDKCNSCGQFVKGKCQNPYFCKERGDDGFVDRSYTQKEA